MPPGDLRMALTALSRPDDSGKLWRTTFQHRFRGDGAMAGHPVGNLVLVGLMQVLGDPVAALDAAGTAARRPRPGAADVVRAVGHRGRRVRSRRGPGAGPDRSAARSPSPRHPVRCSRSRWRRTARGPARRRSRPSTAPTCSRSARAPGSPACCRTCCCPTCRRAILAQPRAAPRRAQPRCPAGGDGGLLAGAAPGRTLCTRPGAAGGHGPGGSVGCRAAAAAWPPRRAGSGRRLELADVRVPGTARHDPARLSAALATELAQSLSPARERAAAGSADGSGR